MARDSDAKTAKMTRLAVALRKNLAERKAQAKRRARDSEDGKTHDEASASGPDAAATEA